MNTTPKWFTAVAVVALLWNIIGLIAVIINMLLTPEQIAAMPTEQQTLLEDPPLWSTLASLLAVSTGTLGCLALLFKKKLGGATLYAVDRRSSGSGFSAVRGFRCDKSVWDLPIDHAGYRNGYRHCFTDDRPKG